MQQKLKVSLAATYGRVLLLSTDLINDALNLNGLKKSDSAKWNVAGEREFA